MMKKLFGRFGNFDLFDSTRVIISGRDDNYYYLFLIPALRLRMASNLYSTCLQYVLKLRNIDICAKNIFKYFFYFYFE